MSGMYPEEQKINIYGKDVSWPGLKDGKFTNGDFNDPLVPPSMIPADTVNLILDNLNNLVTSMGGTPDNAMLNQLVALFTVTATAHKGVKRDADGRAKVAAPAAADDIARKAEIDAEATARANADNTLQGNINTHTANRSNPHAVTKAQVGLGSADNTADVNKSVKYAASAGNADTLDGYHAGGGVNQLVPVVAANFGQSSGYIKYANGLIMQWGFVRTAGYSNTTVIFPISFSNNKYSISFGQDNDLVVFYRSKSSSLVIFCSGIYNHANAAVNADWIAIGI